MGRNHTQDTIDTTGYNKSELILVLTRMVRSGIAKNVSDAINQLDEGKHDTKALLDQVIQQYQEPTPEGEADPSYVKVR
jgi:hypothetical protein